MKETLKKNTVIRRSVVQGCGTVYTHRMWSLACTLTDLEILGKLLAVAKLHFTYL